MSSRKKEPTVIYLAAEQVQHIEGLIDSGLITNGKNAEFAARLRSLKDELDKAKVVPSDQLPAEVVRIGSWVELEDRADGAVDQYQLVYPEFSDLSLGRISLMTPMGIALLGEKEGREVVFQAPSGPHKIRIRRVSSEPFEQPREEEESLPQAGIE